MAVDLRFQIILRAFAHKFGLKSPGFYGLKTRLRAVRQHDFGRAQVVAGGAPHDAVQPAGIVAHHPANHRPARRGRFRAEHQPVRFQNFVQIIANNARLHPNKSLLWVDFQNVREVFGNIHHDAAAHDLPGQRRARRPGDERGAVFAGKFDEPFQILHRTWQRNRHGLLLVHRGIGGVDAELRLVQGRIIVKKFAFKNALEEFEGGKINRCGHKQR